MFSPKPQIISLDLRNAQINGFENWLSDTNEIKNPKTISHIKTLIENQSTDENPVALLYVLNGEIFAQTFHNDYLNICFSEELLSDILKLEAITAKDIKPYSETLVDLIEQNPKKDNGQNKLVMTLQKYEEDYCYEYPDFITQVAVIDISPLSMKLKDLFRPLDFKFKRIHSYFKQKYPNRKILHDVIIRKVYLLHEMILGFVFCMKDTNDEKFFWNFYAEDYLNYVERITFDPMFGITINDVLDKINQNGIESLTEQEQNFLNNQQIN